MTTRNQPIDIPARTGEPGGRALDEGQGAPRIAGAALGAAAVSMGLLAGVYYSFSCAVMPGLARTDDRTLVTVMRGVNDAIVNPVFMLSFFGAPMTVTATAALARRGAPGRAASWIAAAAVLCGVGLAVTIAGNIPLNDELSRAAAAGRPDDFAALRRQFEGPWVAWNDVRAAATTAAFACLVRALALSREGAAAPSADRVRE